MVQLSRRQHLRLRASSGGWDCRGRAHQALNSLRHGYRRIVVKVVASRANPVNDDVAEIARSRPENFGVARRGLTPA
jgi:hypothetical protein